MMQKEVCMFFPEIIDLHMHSKFSDGTDTPEEILDWVKEAGIEFFSITDHDSVKAGPVIQKIRRKGDPAFITGVEFSCRDEYGKCHVLGYGYDPGAEEIQRLVHKAHTFRMDKVLARLDFLEKDFGFVFPREVIDKLLSLNNPGKPHIGNLMVRFGYAESKDAAISNYVNKCTYKAGYVDPAEAIRGILQSGGIPVLAHPAFGSGDSMLVGEEMDIRLSRLKEFGLMGVEAYYSRYTRTLREEMLAFAEKYDFLITAGSDYHGTNKKVRLGDTGCTGASQGPKGLLKFMEAVQDRILF